MTNYTLSRAAVDDLRRLSQRVADLERERQPQPSLQPQTIVGRSVAKTGASAITARSGTTPGSGTVTLYSLIGGSLTATTDANDSPITVTAYSFSATASGTTAYIWVGQDTLGYWWYLAEDCA